MGQGRGRRLRPPLPRPGPGLVELATLLPLAIALGLTASAAAVALPKGPASALLLLPEALLTLVILAGTALLLAIVLSLWPHRRGKRDPQLVQWTPPRLPLLGAVFIVLAGVALLAATLAAILLAARLGLLHVALPAAAPATPAAGPIRPPPSPISPPRATQPAVAAWWLAPVAVALLVALAALGLAVRRRLRPPVPEPPGRTLARAADDSLAALRDEPDPRRAVLRAYAAMEAAFDAVGLARRPAETAAEYASRVAAGLSLEDRAPATLARLLALARFSDRRLDESDRRQALEALSLLRRDLT